MYSISRPTRSLDSNAIRSPKAPAPHAGETAQGPSNAGAFSGMKPKEEKLAGYLLARSAMNQKVEGSTLKNLRAAHESVKEATALMPLGRANVTPDILKAGNAYLPLRKMAAQKLFKSMELRERSSGRMLGEADLYRLGAAISQFAETGVCSTFAMSTNPLIATKLADMKDTRAIVAQTHHATLDHGWVEMMPKGTHADEKPIFHGEDVVLDGWCKENLAILREDSYFARLDKNGKADHLKHEGLLNHETGPKALREVEKYKQQIKKNTGLQETYNEYFLERFQYPKVDSDTFGLWNDTTVFHADFLEQAGNALHKEVKEVKANKDVRKAANHASLAEIQAVGVARSLGSNIRGAITEAPGIIAAAKEMIPRPTRKE
ncbi:MAG TPA: hypothetical protein VK465_02965 [Fibrobacteria bacterium]|nr:hypothetical protein [Fibrobacteria bacterium]